MLPNFSPPVECPVLVAGGAAGGREKRESAIFWTQPVTEGHCGLAGGISRWEEFWLTKKKRPSSLFEVRCLVGSWKQGGQVAPDRSWQGETFWQSRGGRSESCVGIDTTIIFRIASDFCSSGTSWEVVWYPLRQVDFQSSYRGKMSTFGFASPRLITGHIRYIHCLERV